MPETRRKILRAASELFSTRGYKATSTKDIARRARVHEATLFRNFGSKRRIAIQAIANVRAGFIDHSRVEYAIENEDFEIGVRLLAKWILDNLSDEYLRLEMVMTIETRGGISASQATQVFPIYNALAARIRKEQKRGTLSRRIDPVIAARALLFTIYGHAVVGIHWPRKSLKMKNSDALAYVDIWLDGMRASGRSHLRE